MFIRRVKSIRSTYHWRSSRRYPVNTSLILSVNTVLVIIILAIFCMYLFATNNGNLQNPSISANNVVDIAKKYLGTRYVWGGNNPSGFDCSGFVQYVYKQAGISIGRDAYAQYKDGIPVGRDELKPGDIIFFSSSGPLPDHEGLYIGNNQFIQMSSTMKKAIISSTNSWYFKHKFIGARRIIK